MKTLYTTYNNFAKRLAIILTLLLTLGVTSVWGAEFSLTNETIKNNRTGKTSYNSYTIGDNWGGRWLINLNGTTYSLQLGYNTSSSKSAYNSHLSITIPQAASNISILIKTNNNTAAGRTFYACSANNKGYVNSGNGDYGKASTSVQNGSATIQITGSPEVVYIYPNGTAYIEYVTVTYDDSPACSYIVTFNSNYGTNATSSQEFTCGETKALTANSFSRTGYTFTEWNTETDGSGVSYTNQQLVSNLAANGETIPLFAQWTPNKYTVNFTASPNGYGTVSQSSIANVPYGTTVTGNSNAITINGTTVTANPAEKDANYSYSFQNWTGIPSGNNVTANCTITANFTREARELTNYRTSCTTETIVTLDPNGGTISNTDGWTENGNGTYSKTHEGTEIALPTATQTNYIFGGWYNGETKYESIPSDLDESITLTAKWLEKQDAGIYWDPESVTVTIDADGNILPEFNNPNEIEGITFSSSNSSVVAVDANGVITLGSTGTTATVTITATFDGNETYAAKTVTCSITVHPSNCKWIETDINDIDPYDEVVVTMGNNTTVYALHNSEKLINSPKALEVTVQDEALVGTDFANYGWHVTNIDGGYQLQSCSDASKYLYGVASYITISSNPTTFSIFTSPENDNKCFMYTIEYTPYYLGHGNESGQTAWTRQTSYNILKSNTLKFYKKTCLPANKFWIDYELANVTCTSEKPAFVGADTEIELSFSAYTGYKLPEQVSITMGGNTLSEEAFAWEAEEGILYIVPEDGITGDIVITVEGCELLAIPTNLEANNITSSSATLSWDEIDHATEYQVHITDDDDSTEDIITTTSNTYYEVTGLSSASEYLWGVTPIASGYCGLTQEAEIFTTLDVYTVTFNTNGGTAVASQTVDHGGKATKPANPTKTGYTFAGWYTEADAEFDFNTPIESATTLYAKWNANKYTITLRQQWSDGGTETATVHFDNNDFSVSPIIVPTRNGYTFGGYYTETGGAGTQLIDVSGAWLNAPTYIEGGKWVYADNLTLYAKWTQNFTITWMANGQLYHTQTAMMGTAIAKPDDPKANELACDDKVFVGWLDKTISGSTNEEPTFVTDFGTIQANKTYYAVFAKLTGTPSNDYNKITDINDLTDGEYVIAYGYETSSPSIILKAEAEDATKLVATSATPTNNKYTSPAAANIWEIKKNGDNYSIYNAATKKYVEATTTPSVGLSDNPEYYTISWNSSYSYWKIQIADFTNYWFVGYIQGETKYFQSYKVTNDKYRIQLYKNASTAVYSDYVTTCVEIPTPHWEGAEIDNANIAVACGTISYKTNASTITFPTDKNYDLTYPITLTASEGFLLSTNKQNDVYEQSVTVTPVQSDDNKGKITQSVHVRADATGKNTNFDGTITISGDQLTEDQIIEVHAVVDCPQYTLTFNDCGATKIITDFAGTSVEEMEPWAEICSEPVQYVFDGWATESLSNGTEGYEKVDFSTFTMPNNNTTTLYAVYRYAEEGGEPVNGYVKVTEALDDWSGDYVIVDETAKKAIKSEYKTDNSSNKTLKAEDVTLNNNMVVSPSEDVIWQIRKKGNYYTMYNETAEKYAYITQDKTEAAGLDDNPQNLSISFNNGIVKIYGETIARCFSYNSTNTEWRTYSIQTYSTGALYRLAEKTIRYTSSLVCGTIEAEDAIVTSTVGQTVKVYVPITLEYSDVASITGTSDNEAFTVVTKNDVAVGESTIEVHYKPTAYVNTANQEETATITLTTSKGATTTFNVTGRCLPETFAIVAKVGNVWYALPSQGLNSETTPVGYPIEVNNNDNPTAVTSLPITAEWSLRNVYKVNGQNDRFTANGENLVFVNAENKTLYANNGNANIQTHAEYTNYAANNPDRYEWVPTTTDLTNYTLKNVGRDKDLSINVNATFGTHASNIASNNLRFLPINATYNPFDMQVVEWYPTKVLVQTEAALTSVSATVGGVAVASPVVTKKGGKLYEISGLPLESNPTQVLTISYDSYSCSKVIPIIISREEKTVENAPFSTLTKAIYNYSDLVVRDGAVLNITGAKNTPDKFVNVTIYPTAKIVVPENNQLSVYTLTFFGGIDDIYDGEKYTTNKYGVPQLSLKGTLGKTVTTMDYIMRVDLEQMYQMGVPYDVNLNEITYWDGTSIELGSQLYVSAYDGQARANRESKTWIWETDFAEKVLKPGIGYTISAEPQVAGDTYSILRLPMTKNISSGDTEEEKKVNVVAYDNQKDVTITDNHKGWNYLSNPYMAAISGAEADSKLVVGYLRETGTGPWEWVDDTYRYVTIPHNDGEDYYQQKFSDATLLPFKSFFLQIETDGKLSFALASRQALPARLLQQENAPREVEFEILLANDTRSDNMGLLIGEDYTPAYEINADLEKMIGSMSVYTIYNGYNLAYNALSPINAQEQIPIGYVVPDVGEYTFKLDENADVENIEHIYLNDLDMNVITDLLEDEYTFYASEKKNEARFVINVIMRSEQEDDTPTRLEELDINTNHAIKFFYQDKLYILRNGIIYDAMGKQVQTINK